MLKLEQIRYDSRARTLNGELVIDAAAPVVCIDAFEYFKKLIENLSSEVTLEMCCGMGEFRGSFSKSHGKVFALDFSANSLFVYGSQKFDADISFVCGNATETPFDNETFDCIIMANSLSYLHFDKYLEEVNRILKPGGSLLLMDVLDNNPIYRLNRFIHFLRGNRSLSVVRGAPQLKNVRQLENFFDGNTYYFGSWVWLFGFLKLLPGSVWAESLTLWLNQKIKFNYCAFRFVFMGKKGA